MYDYAVQAGSNDVRKDQPEFPNKFNLDFEVKKCSQVLSEISIYFQSLFACMLV